MLPWLPAENALPAGGGRESNRRVSQIIGHVLPVLPALALGIDLAAASR